MIRVKIRYAFATSTGDIYNKMQNASNPVTKASYREILQHRFDKFDALVLEQLQRIEDGNTN